MKNRRAKLQKKQSKTEENVYIELDTKCSCPPQSSTSDHASIQFARRYLECQGSMPIRILRSYIERVLPHSSMTQVSIYDSNDQLLNDWIHLKDLSSSSSSSSHIPLRFAMINTVTSFGHCLCSSASSPVQSSSSFSPTIIRRETINRTLSTCPLVPTPPYSPTSSTSLSPILPKNPMPIVNLLTPPSPSHYSSFFIDNIVESNSNNQSIIDQITSEFGEICPSIPSLKTKRPRALKKLIPKSSPSDIPLDLTVKKRPPSSFDLFSKQSKWLKMI